jgi:hypothetical protein
LSSDRGDQRAADAKYEHSRAGLTIIAEAGAVTQRSPLRAGGDSREFPVMAKQFPIRPQKIPGFPSINLT